MNGGQDLGGMQGFGPVIEEQNEPHFHEGWEARVLGLVLATGPLGLWNIDIGRHARETIPPQDYLTFSYYQIWLAGLEKLIARNNLLDEGATAKIKGLTKLTLENVAPTLARGGPANRKAQAFAMTVKLHEKNAFTWQEWADHLSAELKSAGPQDPPENYYLHWLSALEKLLDKKNIATTTERQTTKSAWETASKATPHGRPIVLS